MVKVVKHPDVRREELMDAALTLLTTVGYDALAIEQITQAAEVAKGTFYYYFSSKQDLLVQLVARFGDDTFDYLTGLLPTLPGNAVERFQKLLVAAASFKMARAESALASIPLLYKPENLEVRHRLFEEWHVRCRPLFHPIIEQGHDEGTFDVTDTEAATEIVLSLWMDASIRMFTRALEAANGDDFAADLFRGHRALVEAVERVLGAPPGSFQLPQEVANYRAFWEPFLAALNTPAPDNTRSTR